MNKTLQVLKDRGFYEDCTNLEELSARMDAGPITFYVGVDPTGSSMHVGHLVPLFAASHLQKAGHKAIIIIGGGTARIGDPSGKTEMRKMLTGEQIDSNASILSEQAKLIVDIDGIKGKVVNNWSWFKNLNYIDFLRDIGRYFSVNRMLSFDTYKTRLEKGLSFIEFNYQLLQSYDFLKLYQEEDCNVQLGGSDQWANIVSGIDLVRRVEGKEVFGLTFSLLLTSDGKKMGKTEKGALFLDPNLSSVFDFFQYWRNIDDKDVIKCMKLLTFLSLEEIAAYEVLEGSALNQVKEKLAFELTKIIHGESEALKALEGARAAFGGGSQKDTIPNFSLNKGVFEVGLGLIDLYVQSGLQPSKAEARRLIQQGGAFINDQKIEDLNYTVTLKDFSADQDLILQAGKKKKLLLKLK